MLYTVTIHVIIMWRNERNNKWENMCASCYNNKKILCLTIMKEKKERQKKTSWNEKQEIAPCTVTQSYVFAFLIGKHSIFFLPSLVTFFVKPAIPNYNNTRKLIFFLCKIFSMGWCQKTSFIIAVTSGIHLASVSLPKFQLEKSLWTVWH